jgi:hypothetical protein
MRALAVPSYCRRYVLGVFEDPASAVMFVAEFPPVASESLVATITGRVSVGPYTTNVTIFVVLFRTCNVAAAVGVARHPYASVTGPEMRKPLLSLRIAAIGTGCEA